MQKMSNYHQQDIHLFFRYSKYKLFSKAKKRKRKERNVWQSNTVQNVKHYYTTFSRGGYIMNDEKTKRKKKIKVQSKL